MRWHVTRGWLIKSGHSAQPREPDDFARLRLGLLVETSNQPLEVHVRHTRILERRTADGSVQFEVAQNVGWDQRRFAASAHHQFSKVSSWWAGARSELVPPYFETGKSREELSPPP